MQVYRTRGPIETIISIADLAECYFWRLSWDSQQLAAQRGLVDAPEKSTV